MSAHPEKPPVTKKRPSRWVPAPVWIQRAQEERRAFEHHCRPQDNPPKDVAMCEACGVDVVDREGLCTACIHAVEYHDATLTNAFEVECDGRCNVNARPYRRKQ